MLIPFIYNFFEAEPRVFGFTKFKFIPIQNPIFFLLISANNYFIHYQQKNHKFIYFFFIHKKNNESRLANLSNVQCL